MSQERINSIVAPEAVKQLEELKKGLSEAGNELSNFQKKAAGIELKLGDVSTVMELNTLLKELGETQSNMSKTLKQQVTATEENTKAKLDNIKVQREELKLKNDLDKAAQREQKQITTLTSDYHILSKAYNDTSLKAKNYALQLGATHPLTVAAIKDAQAMSSTLKALDATVGQHTRNVGNYNGVGAQFNQLLRELPNLAISPRTFIMSLSNNISYFGESIAASFKQGAKFKDVLKSMFTGSNALVAGLNIAAFALVAFSDKLFGAGETAEETASNIDKVTDSIDKLVKKELEYQNSLSVFEGKNIEALERELALRKARGESSQSILEAETALLNKKKQNADDEIRIYEELQKFVIYSQGKTAEEVEDLALSLPSSTRVAFTEAVKKAQEDEIDLTQSLITTLQNLYVKSAQAQTDIEVAKEKNIREERERTAKEEEKRRKAEEARLKKELDALTKVQVARINIESESSKAILADQRSTYDEQRAARTQLLFDQQAILEAELNRELDNKDLTETEKLAITLESNLKMLQARNDFAKDIQGIDEKEKQDFEKKEKDRVKAASDADKAIHDKRVEYFNTRKKEYDDEIAKNKEIAAAIQQIANAVLSLSQIGKNQSDERLRQLGVELEKEQQNYQFQIDAIQNSGKTAEEKEKAVQEAQAKTQAKQSELRRKEIEEKRRQAAFDKAAAIASIIVNTAAAIAIALLDPIRPLIKAAAVGAAGAAQLAVAASAPLPAYKEGTQDHIGGKFIAGDGGEKELVLTKDGRAYMTADTPTVYSEGRGTKVFNQEQINELFAGLNAASMAKVLNSKPEKKDVSNEIADAIKQGTRETVRAITKNRAVQKVSFYGTDNYYNNQVKHRA